MRGYIVVDVNIKDVEGFMEYASRIPKLIDKHGGRYIVKGQGHFVEPDLPNLSRWIFIPPLLTV